MKTMAARSLFISSILRSSSAFSTRAMSFTRSTAPPSRISRATASVVLAASVAASNFSSMPSYCDAVHEEDTTIVMPFPEDILQHDHYSGITLRVDELAPDQTMDPNQFLLDLQDALDLWKAEGKRGIWIEIPTEYSHLVPSCVAAGFDFHLAKPGMVTLQTWLPDSPSRLPNGPTHQVGIGALVLHPTEPNKMLCVQEKTGPAAAKKLWKMPTGLADPMEDVADAAIRELKEETGLDAKFEGIVCFRQAHTASGASDLFFVCLLKLEDEDAVESHVAQQEEIAAIAWMTMDEYANQEVWQGSPLYKELNEAMMRAAKQQQKPHGFVEAKLPVGFRPGTNSLYMSRM